MPEGRYTVDVTPKLDDQLNPVYEWSVYRMIPAGVCGPFTDQLVSFSIDEIDMQLHDLGFDRVGNFGPICADGFASAELVKVDR